MRPGEGLRSLSPFKFLSRCGELSARFLYRPQTGRQTRSVKKCGGDGALAGPLVAAGSAPFISMFRGGDHTTWSSPSER